MPVKIKTLPGGEFRGEQSATAEMNKNNASKKQKMLQSMATKIAKAADPGGRVSPQDIARAMTMARGMMMKKKAYGGKVAPKKKMMYGGKAKKK
jgi:hypothetical protein|tara:strand:+ start:267 stop:548 length:282 start_codon:yes stop_codon:yes gene_type:complete